MMDMITKDFPVRYLGVPLISTRLRACDCEYIKQKILCQIQSWTNIALSSAGRIQLAISMLHGLQAYWACVFVLPKQILKEIDSAIRRFVWSGTELKKTGAKVAWSEVCCPQKEGGLGTRSVDNEAFMGKGVFDFGLSQNLKT